MGGGGGLAPGLFQSVVAGSCAEDRCRRGSLGPFRKEFLSVHWSYTLSSQGFGLGFRVWGHPRLMKERKSALVVQNLHAQPRKSRAFSLLRWTEMQLDATQVQQIKQLKQACRLSPNYDRGFNYQKTRFLPDIWALKVYTVRLLGPLGTRSKVRRSSSPGRCFETHDSE